MVQSIVETKLNVGKYMLYSVFFLTCYLSNFCQALDGLIKIGYYLEVAQSKESFAPLRPHFLKFFLSYLLLYTNVIYLIWLSYPYRGVPGSNPLKRILSCYKSIKCLKICVKSMITPKSKNLSFLSLHLWSYVFNNFEHEYSNSHIILLKY